MFIPGHSSNVFLITFVLHVKNEDEELIFLKSILHDMMCIFGNDFEMNYISNRQKYKNDYFSLKFPSYYWTKTFSCMVSSLINIVNSKQVLMTNVVLTTHENWENTRHNMAWSYQIIAKDGTYTKKTKTTVIRDIHIPTSGVFEGVEIPNYKYETVYF